VCRQIAQIKYKNNHIVFACPASAQKAWIALELSDCEYILEEIELYGKNGKPEYFLRLNPAGTVPVLVSGRDVFADSEDILDYLSGGNLGGILIDEEAEGAAKWRKTVTDRITPVGKRAVVDNFVMGSNDLFALLEEVDKEVVGPYLCGKQPSSADCAAFPFLWRIDDEFGLPDTCKKLKAWLLTCNENPNFQKTVQPMWWWWW